jgi:hypothetical protein
MKARIVLALALILVLLMASSASVAATAGDAATRAVGAAVPFEAIFHATCEQTGFDPETGIATYQVQGEGWATHLRRSGLDAETAVNVYQGPPYPYWGDFTITGANGDQIFGTVDGAFSYPWVTGTFEIIGGTGSYEGVIGAGVFRGWTDGTGSNDWMHYKGTLIR